MIIIYNNNLKRNRFNILRTRFVFLDDGMHKKVPSLINNSVRAFGKISNSKDASDVDFF